MYYLKLLILLVFIISYVKSRSLNDFTDDIDNTISKYFINNECQLPDKLKKEISDYEPIVNMIIEKITNDFKGETWNALAELTDKFGGRLAGSKNLENAIDYMVDKFKESNLENVHTEDAKVLNWVRGYESATLVSPRKANLPILGLGGTIGTPRGGIIADAVVVRSFDELSKLPDDLIFGKIVVFVEKWTNYGETVEYRGRGASVASKRGAVASLIRSVTSHSSYVPHTGYQRYEDGVKKIPTACITVEDAEMLLRMYQRGENITIHLEMEDRNLSPVISRNIIGELSGNVNNSTVVIVSGHFDSWDVGVGAMDDGGGAFISYKAVQYLKRLGLRPKRTIRAILWTGEEQGYLGARAYYKSHYNNSKNEFNFFMESDMGTFEPLGIDFTGNQDAECIIKEILPLMKKINATKFDKPADGGPDISLWENDGFPLASLINKNERYFWYHHSAGDSMLVEDPDALDKCTALWAAFSYIIADLSIEIPKDLKF